MKTLPLLLLVCLFGLLLPSCEDDNSYIPAEPVEETPLEKLDRLVPITQTGANRFGCLINGKVWRNQGGSVFSEDIGAGYYNLNSSFSLSAIRSTPNDDWFETYTLRFIETDILDSANSVYLPQTSSFTFEGRFDSPNYEGRYFMIDSIFSQIKVTHVDADILSGTFKYRLQHETSGEILEVTNGRFDVSYLVF